MARPNEGFAWHNLYDEDDALGWPFNSWNPLSHGDYWTNRQGGWTPDAGR
jgi:hypothetical protein